MQTIDLAAPRVISIEDRGRQYSLTLRPIPARDWLAYFEGVVSMSETVDGKRVDSSDSSAARLELVEKNLIDLKGYAPLPQLDGHAPTLKDWQKQLPLSHRLAVANQLIAVEPAARAWEDSEPIALGAETVYLDAVWGADDSGTMRKFSNLRHDFKTLSSEHQRRYSRDASRSRIVGGSRSGKTQWLGAQATLAALYDELIAAVDGYSVDGQPLSDVEQIRSRMDTYHKVAAADQLFSPAIPKFDAE